MTDGDQQRTVAWMKEHRADYAWTVDRTLTLVGTFNVPAYPYVVLLSPGGTIAWAGPGLDLKEETVRQALRGALRRQPQAWRGSSAAALDALSKRRFGQALDLARALGKGADDPVRRVCLRDVETVLAAAAEGAREAERSGDVQGALERATLLARELPAHPVGRAMKTLAAGIVTDQGSLAVIEAQGRVRAARREAFADRARASVNRDALLVLAKEHPRTFLGAEAALYAGFLDAVLKKR